ncbi:MAG TPA: hypothetical protein DEQ38_14295 [Elusimicrobia bacterium]|nr:MAG: hypothetical protein A2089_06995 [Elusimicrobia bacterium GWD2_63_28]HCC49266.1 hypothetical protein [Elusimicrobiota bacterium]
MRINIKARCAALCLAAALPAVCGAAPARRPSVVLVIYDTVRADRTSPYGYAASATPALGKFAAGAVVFEKAYANSNWTGSSFATILTGRRLFSHGLAGFLDSPAADIPSMPALLSAGGYETAAFFSGLPGEAGYSFGRGFGRFAAVSSTCPFSYQVAAALEWKKSLPPEKDFFLAVHGLDVHSPRNCAGGDVEKGPGMPPMDAAFLDYFNDSPGRDLARLDPQSWKQVLAYKRDPAFLARLSRDYDRCVSQLDRGLGSLLRALEEEKDRPLLIIVTSDHGQLLGEHGRLGHVSTVYEQLVRVPLLVRFPGGAGRREAAVAEHADLLPTVCAAAGIPCPDGLDGQNLAAPGGKNWKTAGWVTASASGPPGSVRQVRHAAFYDGTKKLARHGPRWELFDLAADPGETADLAEARPADFLRLASGYLAISGAEKITAGTVYAEGAENCSRPDLRPEAAPPASPCGRAAAAASRLAGNLDFEGAAAELKSSGCPEPELLRYREALRLLRAALLARGVRPYEGYTFSAAPGLWKTAKDGYSAAFGPAGGLRCEVDGRPSSAPGCVPPAAALLDCLEKYRFDGAAAPEKSGLEQALKKAGYIQ